MDKDRIAGAAKGIKGSVKEAIGKAVGDFSSLSSSGEHIKGVLLLVAASVDVPVLRDRGAGVT